MIFSLEELLAQIRKRSRFLLALGLLSCGYASADSHEYRSEQPPDTTASNAAYTPSAPVHIVHRGENLWTIVTKHYHPSTDGQTTRLVNSVVYANATAEPSLLRDTKSVVDGHVKPIPDGVLGDYIYPGERITLSDFTHTKSTPTQAVPQSLPHHSTVPYTLIGVGAIAAGATLLARTYTARPAQRFSGNAPHGIDDAIDLYLGNYAHGDARDKRVKDIISETEVSARQLYKTIRERGLMTRREIARYAKEYVAEKLAHQSTSITSS